MSAALGGLIAAAVGAGLLILLLRKRIQAVAAARARRPPDDPSHRRFAAWDVVSGLGFLVLGGAATYVWWRAFSWLALLYAVRFEHAAIHVWPTGPLWCFPAILAGIDSAMFLAERLMMVLLKDRFSAYAAYQDARYGVRVAKLKTPIYWVLSWSTVILLVMLSNWYTLFTQDNVIVKPFFAFAPKTYPYSDITRIVTAPSLTAPNGDIVHRREYVISFASGETWTTNLAPADLSPNQKDDIARWVSRMSGKPVTEIERFRRDELY
jgi:hypothetical protein